MNSLHTKIPKKIDLRPKKHHGFYIFIWIMGMLLPPLGECVHDGHGACGFVMGRMGDFREWLGQPEAYRPGGRLTGVSSLGARPVDPIWALLAMMSTLSDLWEMSADGSHRCPIRYRYRLLHQCHPDDLWL